MWVWGWTVALGVGTVGNLVPVPFVQADERIDWYTGAVTTVIGIVPLLRTNKVLVIFRFRHEHPAKMHGPKPARVAILLLGNLYTQHQFHGGEYGETIP